MVVVELPLSGVRFLDHAQLAHRQDVLGVEQVALLDVAHLVQVPEVVAVVQQFPALPKVLTVHQDVIVTTEDHQMVGIYLGLEEVFVPELDAPQLVDEGVVVVAPAVVHLGPAVLKGVGNGGVRCRNHRLACQVHEAVQPGGLVLKGDQSVVVLQLGSHPAGPGGVVGHRRPLGQGLEIQGLPLAFVHAAIHHGGHLRPGDGHVGAEHAVGVAAGENARLVEQQDLVGVGGGVVHVGYPGHVVALGPGVLRHGVGQQIGQLVALGVANVGVELSLLRDAVGQAVVHCPLVPGPLGGGDLAAAAVGQAVEPGGRRHGLCHGEAGVGAEGVGGGAAHQTVLIAALHRPGKPGALRHIGKFPLGILLHRAQGCAGRHAAGEQAPRQQAAAEKSVPLLHHSFLLVNLPILEKSERIRVYHTLEGSTSFGVENMELRNVWMKGHAYTKTTNVSSYSAPGGGGRSAEL